ncbi:MAG: hypothetical protein IKO64_05510 [Kiritimatiellae bacterium]|nr:hypothetical protein [Kiritimatiellia bacterium]
MSEQAKVSRLSTAGQMIIGCDDPIEGLHLRVSRHYDQITVEVHKHDRKYSTAVAVMPHDWSTQMVRLMAVGIFNGLRSWSGRTRRKRANKQAKQEAQS